MQERIYYTTLKSFYLFPQVFDFISAILSMLVPNAKTVYMYKLYIMCIPRPRQVVI